MKAGVCVSTVSIVGGGPGDRLSVAIVVADGADRADGVFDSAHRRCIIPAWKRRRLPERAGDFVDGKGYPGNLMALRWTARRGGEAPATRSSSHTQAARRVVSEGCRPCNRRRGANHNPGGQSKVATRA